MIKALLRREHTGTHTQHAGPLTIYCWLTLCPRRDSPEGMPSAAFQRRALEETGVVTLPGTGFGQAAEGFLRIALTVATPRLVEAANRLGKVLAAV